MDSRIAGARHAVAPGMLVAVCALAVLLLAGCSSAGGASTDGLAATYDDTSITEQQVSDYTATYRARIDAKDDEAWARYLKGQGLTASTWRERAIRNLVTRDLVEKRADELGIAANERDVENTVAEDMASRGIEDGDESMWEEALAQDGMTAEEYREECAFSSMEQQVIIADSADDADQDEDALDEYVKSDLANRVVRKFSVLSFGAGDKKQAKAALAELRGLRGKELARDFAERAAELASSEQGASYSGDLGWNFLYSMEGVFDGDDILKMKKGTLYGKLVHTGDSWQIYLCTGRYEFKSGSSYKDVTDESLRRSIRSAAAASSWSTTASNYLGKLVEDANVQVYPMPDGLEYDVDSTIETLG